MYNSSTLCIRRWQAIDSHPSIFHIYKYIQARLQLPHSHHNQLSNQASKQAHDIAIEYKYHGIMMIGIQAIYKYFLALLFYIMMPRDASPTKAIPSQIKRSEKYIK